MCATESNRGSTTAAPREPLVGEEAEEPATRTTRDGSEGFCSYLRQSRGGRRHLRAGNRVGTRISDISLPGRSACNLVMTHLRLHVITHALRL